jgi:hypothetical protein
MRQWVCINNKGYEEQLIIGKVYNEINSNFVDHQCILIKDETGMPSEYHLSIFVTIDEWRDSQLKKIGI